MTTIEAELLATLISIRDARDHYAEHGEYPAGGPTECFDDWAADLVDAALEKTGLQTATPAKGYELCPVCAGTGFGPLQRDRCCHCRGTGTTQAK